ncbi:hypothetical protein GGX14DRAFT_633181 [Mycena pura]|uniref:C2H2-type domain-containing protein n=1 Tax=Mycena pura TaxID=153505 RepID=A0AAD6VEJ3_9AGAR|nr:hypothetical protein GGX14DRAFT_633181 [Mycena pura]
MSESFFHLDGTRSEYHPPTTGELNEHALNPATLIIPLSSAPEVFDTAETASNFLGLKPVWGEYCPSDFYPSQYPFETRSHPDPVVGGQSDYAPDMSEPWRDACPDAAGSVQPDGLERAGFASQNAPSSGYGLDVPRAYPPYASTGEVIHANNPAPYPIPAPGSLSFTATFNVDPGAFWQPPNAIPAPQFAYNPYHAANYAVNHVEGAWGPHQLPSFPPLPAHVPPSYIAPGPPPDLATTSSALQPQSMAPASSTREERSWRAVSVFPLLISVTPSNTVCSNATGRPSARRPQCPAINALAPHEIRAAVKAAAVADDATEIRCQWDGCGTLVTLGTLCAHMSGRHGCVKGMTVSCAWEGCTYPATIGAGSLVKHLRSAMHLNIKTRCARCNSDFARPDALGRHLRSDAKGKERARARASRN